VNLIFLAN